MGIKKVFERKETKYILTAQQFPAFFSELQQYMEIDQYGLHTIQSLYFDTNQDDFIRHSIQKPDYKEKFRVRSYGIAKKEGLVFLEIKKKVKGIVYKRRLPLTYAEFLMWQQTNVLPESILNSQIGLEIQWLFKKHPDLTPRVCIAYDRYSLFYEEDDQFRVTFDQNIRFSTEGMCLHAPQNEQLVAPEMGILMEVKAMGAYPLWFVELLNRHSIRKSSFSKYAQTYQRHLFVKEDAAHVV